MQNIRSEMDNPETSYVNIVSHRKYVNANNNIQFEEIRLDVPVHSRIELGAKRVIDILVSFAGLVTLAPFFALVAICIAIDSRGPIFFRQTRWGKMGRKIGVFKFRSMHTNLGDITGVAQTVRDDPRVTKVGAFLRRTNVDELPQLINVLLGHMSLVGPRCHAINMQAAGKLYEELVPEYHMRHLMRPGITGLAQMRGLRGPTDRADVSRARIACDIFYIRHFSLMLDFKILIGTVLSELKGGAGF